MLYLVNPRTWDLGTWRSKLAHTVHVCTRGYNRLTGIEMTSTVL